MKTLLFIALVLAGTVPAGRASSLDIVRVQRTLDSGNYIATPKSRAGMLDLRAISAQVYDYLGYPVGSASTYTSDGQVWDRVPINSPSTSGTYYIHVTVGSYTVILGYTVL